MCFPYWCVQYNRNSHAIGPRLPSREAAGQNFFSDQQITPTQASTLWMCAVIVMNTLGTGKGGGGVLTLNIRHEKKEKKKIFSSLSCHMSTFDYHPSWYFYQKCCQKGYEKILNLLRGRPTPRPPVRFDRKKLPLRAYVQWRGALQKKRVRLPSTKNCVGFVLC